MVGNRHRSLLMDTDWYNHFTDVMVTRTFCVFDTALCTIVRTHSCKRRIQFCKRVNPCTSRKSELNKLILQVLSYISKILSLVATAQFVSQPKHRLPKKKKAGQRIGREIWVLPLQTSASFTPRSKTNCMVLFLIHTFCPANKRITSSGAVISFLQFKVLEIKFYAKSQDP